MPREPRGEPEPQPNGQPPGPQLVSADEMEEAIASMLRIWGVYVTAGVLGHYREVLAGLPAAAVVAAVKRWLRTPLADRAARPHELRDLAESVRGRPPAPVPEVDALARGRATPAEIAEVFAHGFKHPDTVFVRELLAYRARYRRQWEEGSPC